MWSGAVGNDAAILWQVVQFLRHIVGEHSERIWQCCLPLTPCCRIPGIDESELLAAIHSFLDFVHRHTCWFHLLHSFADFWGISLRFFGVA